MKVPSGNEIPELGVLLSVEDSDYSDAAILASRFSRVGMKIYNVIALCRVRNNSHGCAALADNLSGSGCRINLHADA